MYRFVIISKSTCIYIYIVSGVNVKREVCISLYTCLLLNYMNSNEFKNSFFLLGVPEEHCIYNIKNKHTFRS